MDLAARLYIMNRALDRMVPDSPHERFNHVIEIMLEAVAQHKITIAVTALEQALRETPFWLRGYLLLATIHEYADQSNPAIMTIERGLDMCAKGFRLNRAPRRVAEMEKIHGGVIRKHIRRNLERLTRYERMFRHRMAMLQVRRGCFDEAIEQWAAIGHEHCV